MVKPNNRFELARDRAHQKPGRSAGEDRQSENLTDYFARSAGWWDEETWKEQLGESGKPRREAKTGARRKVKWWDWHVRLANLHLVWWWDERKIFAIPAMIGLTLPLSLLTNSTQLKSRVINVEITCLMFPNWRWWFEPENQEKERERERTNKAIILAPNALASQSISRQSTGRPAKPAGNLFFVWASWGERWQQRKSSNRVYFVSWLAMWW